MAAYTLATVSPISRQTAREEAVSCVILGVGLLLALAAAPLLVTATTLYRDARHVVSVSIYGGALVLMFLVGLVYHAVREDTRKRRLQVLDHIAIYIFIAGTYTPFTLVTLHGGLGWSLFGIVWGAALIGAVYKMIYADRHDRVSTLLYVAIGWVGLVAAIPIARVLSLGDVLWLVAGGVVYTLGTLFYLWERLPFNQAVWHGFVLTGSICHFCAISFGPMDF